MPEKKISLARIIPVAVPILSVTIAAISLYIALASKKKELSFTYLGSENLVSVSNIVIPGLQMNYEGKAITSLTKMRFVLRNEGASAIKAEDVKEPIKLEFANDVQLLSSIVERTMPEKFSFTATLTSDRKLVECKFNLLNSGDEAYFAVYVHNSSTKIPNLTCRIVDVKQPAISIEQIRRREPLGFIANTGIRSAIYWILSVLHGALAVLLLVVWLGEAIRFIRSSIWESRYRKRFLSLCSELEEKDEKASIYKIRPAYLFSEKPELFQEKGIPKPVGSGFILDWKGLLGFSLIFVALVVFLALSSLYIFTSPIW
jgi:hypothetical protein